MPQPTEVFMVQATPVGYGALVDRHALSVVPPHRWTFIAKQGAGRSEPGRIALRLDRDPSRMTDLEHLLFGLKHEGVCLQVIEAFVDRMGRERFENDLTTCIRATPQSKYVRVLWFLHEWRTKSVLDVADLEGGTYVPVLDPGRYVVGNPRRVRRQRVLDNLLGGPAFCPFVRRTDALDAGSPTAMRDAMTRIASDYDPSVLARALAFLYTKETMSSFAMEREIPSSERAEKFGQLLRRAGDLGVLDETTLTGLQNAIVDPRFAEPGYRAKQNYVGEFLSPTRQRIHYVPPRPDALADLMSGWCSLAGHLDRDESGVDPIVAAACLSFGFVYLHPFEDGNGRLHRFVVHHVLGRRGVTPPRFIVPVSAVMLAHRVDYDAALEAFSTPLLATLDYVVDEEGALDVTADSRNRYRFIDLTEHAVALYRWLDEAVREELPSELAFLVALDRTKLAMQGIVDMPSQLRDLFVKIVLQNGGRLSTTKRASHFETLTDEEIARLERAIEEHMPKRSISPPARGRETPS